MFQQIRTRHVSEYGIDGPPEQETNSTRANTHSNDKWAQEGTHGLKGGGRWAHWEAGRPAGRPTRPMGPTASTLPRGAPSLAPNVGSVEKSCDLGVAPSYKYKGRGRGMNTHTHLTLSTHPSSVGA